MSFLKIPPNSNYAQSTASVFSVAQRQVRKKLLSGASLTEVMDTLLLTLESAYPDIVSSVLLLDPKKEKLFHISAPHLPEAFGRAIDGTTIGPAIASCGTAAFIGERVVVKSIATDIRWADYQIALEHGLKACWSQPIFSLKDDSVLGTFAIYYKTEREPTEEEIQLLEYAADLAGSVIEWKKILTDKEKLEQELKESNASLYSLNRDLAKRITQGTKELEKQSFLTKTITENATTALLLSDARGYCTYMNPAAEEMTGFTFEEITEKPLHYMIHHHHADGSPFPIEDCRLASALVNNMAVRGVEDLLIRKDGTYFPVLCSSSPIYDEEGAPTSIVMEVRDITEEKRMQRELLEVAERMQTLLSAMPQIAYITAQDGKLEFVNEQWHAYTGLDTKEALGEHWKQALHPDDLDNASDVWLQCINTGNACEVEYRIRNKDGNYRWHLVRSLPLRNQKGEILNWLGTATDIHEQKLLIERLASAQGELQRMNMELTQDNKKLEHTNADLDNFIYAASHDLKAPMANLEGLVTAMQQEFGLMVDKSRKAELLLTMMDKSIARFRQTIAELTNVSRVQKEVNLTLENVEFREVVEELKQEYESYITQSEADIITDFTAAPTIYFSKKNLRSIIYNLVSNGLKYRHPDRSPVVKVVTTPYGENEVLLSVEDNGLGIEEKHLGQIFGMFKRLHHHVDGSGVGLYLVKRIVDNAGGEIKVSSKIGEGTRFEIRLPNAAAE